MELGVLLGLSTLLVVSSFIGTQVFHGHNGDSAFLVGMMSAFWVAIPCIRRWGIDRKELLKPQPKKYPLPARQAFVRVREILSRASYKVGSSKWNVGTADTQAMCIHATLAFKDEKKHAEGSSPRSFRIRTELAPRFVEVDMDFQDQDGSCVIQLDFDTQIKDWWNYRDADFVVRDLAEAVERELGSGVAVGETPTRFLFEPPPWWVLALSGIALSSYADAVTRMLMK